MINVDSMINNGTDPSIVGFMFVVVVFVLFVAWVVLWRGKSNDTDK